MCRALTHCDVYFVLCRVVLYCIVLCACAVMCLHLLLFSFFVIVRFAIHFFVLFGLFFVFAFVCLVGGLVAFSVLSVYLLLLFHLLF